MSDRIPGSSWSNPIRYRNYRIYLGPAYTPHDIYEYCHEEYDGPEDPRAGFASSEADAKESINELEDN